MRALTIALCIISGVVATALPATAAPKSGAERYVLEFRRTQNLPKTKYPRAEATLTMKVVNGETVAHLRLRGTQPNMLYTIWIVFNILECADCGSSLSVPSYPASLRQDFPAEGNGVAPLARLDDAFTSGMGLDPGIVVVTNDRGDGEVTAKLDYDLIRKAPVGNKDIIQQCRLDPSYTSESELKVDSGCSEDANRAIRITTTWLRKFVMDVVQSVEPCANPGRPLWQCIDPATVDPHTGSGLPRVPRFEFDHFRLAAHPDLLTHGFIGGNSFDHEIDMVGLRCDVVSDVPVEITRPSLGGVIVPATSSTPAVLRTCPDTPVK
jgi:hypothetical protein